MMVSSNDYISNVVIADRAVAISNNWACVGHTTVLYGEFRTQLA